MKINIVGGGPAALFFAVLGKRLDPANEVTVFERRPRASTFGWGIAFTARTLVTLRVGDQVLGDRVAALCETWGSLDIVHQRSKVSFPGMTYHGLARLALLEALYARCEELGVALHFDSTVSDPQRLADADLLVGADGVKSAVRKAWEDEFKPTLTARPNYHVWYGTKKVFPGVTLTFRPHEAGLFVAHSYKMDAKSSTFIVDCSAKTRERAGLAAMPDDELRAFLGDVFREDLGGHALLSRESKWLHFVQVRNQRWTHDNVVLLGDAAHTVHFSAGAGTTLAMEDALALSRALAGAPNVHAGLAAFERDRKPAVDKLQASSETHRLWMESAAGFLDLEPLEFAANLLSLGDAAVRAEVRTLPTIAALPVSRARKPAKPRRKPRS